MRYLLLSATIFVSMASSAQPSPRPQFEIASVRPVPPGDNLPPTIREFARNQGRPGQIPMASPDRIRLKNWPLLDLIAAAYSVRTTQVSGPAWLSNDAFDIEAKVPDGTPKEELNAMLESLLEDRFSLSVHRETATKDGFALVIGKNGPNMKIAAPSTAPSEPLTQAELTALFERQLRANIADVMAHNAASDKGGAFERESWPSVTTNQLAAALVRFVGAPVVDEAGLTGKYAASIEISKNSDVPGESVFDAVRKLGLELDRRKIPIETVIVDHVSKTPAPN